MLDHSQTDQGQNRANAGFQRAGTENMSRTTSTAVPGTNREAAAQSSSKPRKTSNGQSGGPANPPTHDEIAARAFQIYCKKGRPEGRDTENWLEAEAELLRERRGAAGAKR